MFGSDDPARDYRYYRWAQIGFIVFLVVYNLTVLYRESQMGRGEIFPIASWSLFSIVPNEVHDYSVLIHEVDGQAVSPPTLWEESEAHFEYHFSHAAYVILEQMGRAKTAGNTAQFEQLRAKFEMNFMSEADDVRYDFVERRYDPMIRWKDGSFRSVSPLASFRKQDSES